GRPPRRSSRGTASTSCTWTASSATGSPTTRQRPCERLVLLLAGMMRPSVRAPWPAALACLALFVACGASAPAPENDADASQAARPAPAAARPPAAPPVLAYRIVRTFPHDRGAFTQGLQFVDGELYEGTGQWGQSSLR